MFSQIVAGKHGYGLIGFLPRSCLLVWEGRLLQRWELGRVWLNLHALNRPVDLEILALLVYVGQVSLLL